MTLTGVGGVDPTQSLTSKIIFWQKFFKDATSATSGPWEVAPWWIRGDCPASLFQVDLPDPGDEPPPEARFGRVSGCWVENLGCWHVSSEVK